MIINYLTVAVRLLKRHKINTVTNAIGIGVAMASVILVGIYVSYERSFDTFHPDHDLIYQVSYEEVATPAMRHIGAVSPPTAPAMVAELSEVTEGLRLRIGESHRVQSEMDPKGWTVLG
ncbi:MAG: hypothetical protein O3B41_09145 [Bacteroidetes bacterium]|nr:hypothetical protein [Bacteroidota bacterium]